MCVRLSETGEETEECPARVADGPRRSFRVQLAASFDHELSGQLTANGVSSAGEARTRWEMNGERDGARTRDLRRDRPAL
jgi:hypothetical protein